MPQYVYDCLACESQMHIRHSYRSVDITCTACGSDKIVKNLSTPFNDARVKNNNPENSVGDEVKEAIKNNGHELQEMKKKIKNRVFEKK